MVGKQIEMKFIVNFARVHDHRIEIRRFYWYDTNSIALKEKVSLVFLDEIREVGIFIYLTIELNFSYRDTHGKTIRMCSIWAKASELEKGQKIKW